MNLSVGKLTRIGAVLAALMLALTLLACTQADEDQQADPFTIGVMESLTGPRRDVRYGGEPGQNTWLLMKSTPRVVLMAVRSSLLSKIPSAAAQDAISAYNKLTKVDGLKNHPWPLV